MIYSQSNLRVVDDSGVSVVRCIMVVKKRFRSFAFVGNRFIGVVSNLAFGRSTKKIKKGQVIQGLVTSTKKFSANQKGGSLFISSLRHNHCVLIKKDMDFFSQKSNIPFLWGLKKTIFLKNQAFNFFLLNKWLLNPIVCKFQKKTRFLNVVE